MVKAQITNLNSTNMLHQNPRKTMKKRKGIKDKRKLIVVER